VVSKRRTIKEQSSGNPGSETATQEGAVNLQDLFKKFATIADVQSLIQRQDALEKSINEVKEAVGELTKFIGSVAKKFEPYLKGVNPSTLEGMDINELIKTFLQKEIMKNTGGKSTLDEDLNRLKALADVAQAFSPAKALVDGILKRVGEKIGVKISEEI